ncbi:hypothetical protein P5673_030374 [Acropora cervicornis]|uniref:Uncharacterized protein n=1 Tax=Acropora cervicornis TaxID=6130 RepID=A0AAD9UTM4_ACRCE|nr:hypothetical protein P5673_030374 [Acropora cervicornis]
MASSTDETRDGRTGYGQFNVILMDGRDSICGTDMVQRHFDGWTRFLL